MNTANAKLAALVASLVAITIEDIQAVKAAGLLTEDAAANIVSLKATADGMDDETITLLNAERTAAGLPAI
jgi:hypothetical protein